MTHTMTIENTQDFSPGSDPPPYPHRVPPRTDYFSLNLFFLTVLIFLSELGLTVLICLTKLGLAVLIFLTELVLVVLI